VWVSTQDKTHRHSERLMANTRSEARNWDAGTQHFAVTAVFNRSHTALIHLGKCYSINDLIYTMFNYIRILICHLISQR